MIRVTPHIALDESEIVEQFIRASGPGGQNVNKVASAVQLRFDVDASPALDPETRARLKTLAGRRLTRDGVIVITAERFRTRERNRDDALERLIELIRRAAQRPKTRRPTRVTAGAKARRRDDKAKRGQLKRQRRSYPGNEG
ncbi:MAG TPA: alternative ribosome rescue aminoacyl-tRNA hydrolase ArfB [Stellaceae bacterium]|jgi:ribosome-associated protein|nr:alternative ribosome rescue aminoacyl-tRNA hydrolase ArfB [Stellaceae bacterium]